MIRQELNPETCRLDTKQCRYVYTGPGGCLRWPPTPPGPRWPPSLKLELERERTKEEKEREVLHLFRCYTHTHPAGAGSTLKGKRKKKADTRRADGQKQRRGGRGTDGPPEPTYTAKRTWPKQRTHLNPTTRYGEARRERLGTKWGTSWCQTKNKTIS